MAVAVPFALSVLAQDIVRGKVEALAKAAKKITIKGTEYSVSDETARVKVRVGDMVEAAAEGNAVKKLR